VLLLVVAASFAQAYSCDYATGDLCYHLVSNERTSPVTGEAVLELTNTGEDVLVIGSSNIVDFDTSQKVTTKPKTLRDAYADKEDELVATGKVKVVAKKTEAVELGREELVTKSVSLDLTFRAKSVGALLANARADYADSVVIVEVNTTETEVQPVYSCVNQSTTNANGTSYFNNCTQSSTKSRAYNVTQWVPVEGKTFAPGETRRVMVLGQNLSPKKDYDWVFQTNASGTTTRLLQMAWWNGNWTKAKSILYWVSSGSVVSGYPLRVNVSYDADMQTDFDDIRFVDGANTTALGYALESKVDGAWAVFNVSLPTGITTSNQSIFMYYGSVSAVSIANSSLVYLYNTSFEDGSGYLYTDGVERAPTGWSLICAHNNYLGCGAGNLTVGGGPNIAAQSGSYFYLIKRHSYLNGSITLATGRNLSAYAIRFYSTYQQDQYAGVILASVNFTDSTNNALNGYIIPEIHAYNTSNFRLGWTEHIVEFPVNAYNVTFFFKHGESSGSEFGLDNINIYPYAASTPGYFFGSEGVADSTAPVSTCNSNGSYSAAAYLVTLNATDASGVDYLTHTYNGASSNATTFTASVEGNQTISRFAVDPYGNFESLKYCYAALDLSNPTGSDNAPTGWQVTNVPITITPADTGGSGVKETKYCVDSVNSCTPSITYSGAVTVSADGTSYFRYQVTDNVGRISTVYSKTIQIDKTDPTGSDNSTSNWVRFNPLVAVSSSDVVSGVASTLCCADLTNTCTPATPYSSPVLFSTEGVSYFRCNVSDNAGRSYSWSSTVRLDKTAPVTGNNAPASWQKTPFYLNWSVTETLSGWLSTMFRLNSGSWQSGNATLVNQVGNNTYAVNTTDVAGNQEASKTVYGAFDNIAPTLTSNAPITWSKVPFNITFTPVDAHSGVASTGFVMNGSYQSGLVALISTEGNLSVAANSTDNAGNVGAPKAFYGLLDLTAPVTGNNAPVAAQAAAFNVTLSPTDALSGPNRTSYRVNEGPWLVGTVVPITLAGNNSFDYNSTDDAGNQEAVKRGYAVLLDSPQFFSSGHAFVSDAVENLSVVVNASLMNVSHVVLATNESGSWQNYSGEYGSPFLVNASSGTAWFPWGNATYARQDLFYQVCANTTDGGWNCSSEQHFNITEIYSVVINNPDNGTINSNPISLTVTATGYSSVFLCNYTIDSSESLFSNNVGNNTATTGSVATSAATHTIYVTCLSKRGSSNSTSLTTPSVIFNALAPTTSSGASSRGLVTTPTVLPNTTARSSEVGVIRTCDGNLGSICTYGQLLDGYDELSKGYTWNIPNSFFIMLVYLISAWAVSLTQKRTVLGVKPDLRFKAATWLFLIVLIGHGVVYLKYLTSIPSH